MVIGSPSLDRRSRRHEATKQEIVDAAWALAREKGVAGVSLGDVAKSVGMRVPSLYSYFSSKNDIYDAMFAQASGEFLDFFSTRLAELPRRPRERLRGTLRFFFDFCTSDPARYQLLFQRTVPGFVPSETSYARAVDALQLFRDDLASAGLLSDQSDQDLLTAIGTGMVDQQISNDPGGTRWARLVDDAADMAYDHIVKKQRGKT
jgi:AcrR family transcriptional regulator